MKRHIKTAARAALFLLLLSLLLATVSFIFSPKNDLKDFGMRDSAANAILGEKENTIDVLVLGDSEAYSSISPMDIWREYGITSYVCATSGQYLYYSDTLLQRAFKTQSPKVVIMETDAIYRKFSISNSVSQKIKNIFSIFEYHDRWKTLRPHDFFSPVEYTWTDDYKGYYYNTHISASKKTDHMSKTDDVAQIPELNKLYLRKMASFCEKNGAAFILVSTPSTVNWNYARHNGIAEIAEELGVEYLDLNLMNDRINIDWSRDTRDKGDHLNHYGATKVTSFLGSYISGRYDLPDRRGDPVFLKWDEAFNRVFFSENQ